MNIFKKASFPWKIAKAGDIQRNWISVFIYFIILYIPNYQSPELNNQTIRKSASIILNPKIVYLAMRSNSEFEVHVTNIYVPLIIIFALGLLYSNWSWGYTPDSTFLLSSCSMYLPKWQWSRDHFNFLPQNSHWCGNLTSHKDGSSSPSIGLRAQEVQFHGWWSVPIFVTVL